ncbi:hypothetical protein M3Y94_00435600 [Aphelenchoides besseyi]|nr:hypothetical protein M3Y94_00435600 [Aphelenchoides besseyi]KAI6229446.1 hypothetical protein M3Y95_00531800 [Aphelenchoides besseyi]
MRAMKTILILTCLLVVAESLLIYRPKPRPKLVCYAVPPPERHANAQTKRPVESTSSDADGDGNIHTSPSHEPTGDSDLSPIRPSRFRRSTEEVDLPLDQGFDIELIGAVGSSKYRDDIRKKLIRTCESLNLLNAV